MFSLFMTIHILRKIKINFLSLQIISDSTSVRLSGSQNFYIVQYQSLDRYSGTNKRQRYRVSYISIGKLLIEYISGV